LTFWEWRPGGAQPVRWWIAGSSSSPPIGKWNTAEMRYFSQNKKQANGQRVLLQTGYEVIKNLQYADCTPGYFYRKCLLWKYLSLLASEIAQSMAKREDKLVGNGLLLTAV